MEWGLYSARLRQNNENSEFIKVAKLQVELREIWEAPIHSRLSRSTLAVDTSALHVYFSNVIESETTLIRRRANSQAREVSPSVIQEER